MAWSEHRGHIRCGAALLYAALVFTPATALAQDAPPAQASVEELRELARQALEKYNAGKVEDAIVDWQKVYEQSGRERGYRVAFNLARAYDELGDLPRAGEHYARYIREVGKRRAAGMKIEPNVAEQEDDAKKRLEELGPVTARIVVKLTGPETIRIDGAVPYTENGTHVVYVNPGHHVVRLGAGAEGTSKTISVAQGEQVEVEPPPPPPPPPPPTPPPPPQYRTEIEHPYSKAILYVAGAVSLASIAVPIVFYSNTSTIADDYDAANTPEQRLRDPSAAIDLRADYQSARANAYASLAIPITLGAITLGLTAYYFLGARETQVRVGSVRASPFGVSGSF